MINPTITKFGYPATLVRDYQHWVLLLRPAQVTAGSLVLAAKSDATAYGDLPEAAFTEQAPVVAEIEQIAASVVTLRQTQLSDADDGRPPCSLPRHPALSGRSFLRGAGA